MEYLTNRNQVTDNHIKSVNKIITLSVVSELCALEIKDTSFHDFKQRLNRLIGASKSVQSFFEQNDRAKEYKNIFRNEFLSGRNVLISEILSLLCNMEEDGLEEVLKSISEVVEN